MGIVYYSVDSYRPKILNPQLGDWSVLDFILFPLHSRSMRPTIVADCSLMFSSRHFPTIVQFNLIKCPRAVPPKNVPRFIKPDLDTFKLFHDSLNLSININPPLLLLLSIVLKYILMDLVRTTEIFIDLTQLDGDSRTGICAHLTNGTILMVQLALF